MPETLAGKIGILLAVSTILLAWGAVVIRLARAHIDRRIEKTLECVVKDAVKAEVEPLRLQINNGLSHRTERIEDKLDLLVTTLITKSWNGEERRNDVGGEPAREGAH